MTISSLGLLAGGLALLVVGGDALVRAASRLAAALGVSPIVIGLTVVAFGTSAPEFAVSIQAAHDQQAGVALGNVLGSNVFNVLFILGLAAAITPLTVAQQFVRKEVPLLIVVSGVAWALAANGTLGALEGAGLCLGLLLYTVLVVRHGRREAPPVQEEYAQAFAPKRYSPVLSVVVALAGLGALVLGSRWFVEGATDVARWLGLSEIVIGLVIVAPGTSLPELVTSAIAAFKGERDIAVANVVGSNLFNLLGVLGVTAIVGGGVAVPAAALVRDFPVMVGSAVLCLPIMVSGYRVGRGEGLLLLSGYAAYLIVLLQSA